MTQRLARRLAACVFGVALIGGSPAIAQELTAWGAIAGPNADGTIPAHPGLQQPPAGFVAGKTYPNPFGGESPTLTIDGSNWQQHEGKLTDASKALFRTYGDTYKINVYPTHRTCGLPDTAAEFARQNAQSAELVAGGNGVRNAFYSVSFPQPESGVEVVWNHLLRYRGYKFQREYTAMQVQANGATTRIRINDEGVFRWSDPAKTSVEQLDNIGIYFIQYVVSPPRLAGNALLVHETIDQVKQPRQVWSYNPGTRRVRRAPDVAYDNPGTGSDGMTTSDALNVYNGAPDRYEWNLIGREERIIPYNAYRLASTDTKLDSLVTAKYLNPEYTRHELHRVWIVEGTLKPGARHIYAKRRFYVDEDSWFIVASTLHDSSGNVWRVQEGHLINYWDVQSCNEVATTIHDLRSGTYFVDALINETSPINFNPTGVSDDRYTPAALRDIGTR